MPADQGPLHFGDDDKRHRRSEPGLDYGDCYARERMRQRMRALAPWVLIPGMLVAGTVALYALLTWINR